jgi:hypothetical protein
MTAGIVVFVVVAAIVVTSVYLRRKRDRAEGMPRNHADAFTAQALPDYPGISGSTGFDGFVSPISLPGGVSLRLIADASGGATVRISGFRSNPGARFLMSIRCNGVTMNGADAAHSYSVDSASWTWAGRSFGLIPGSRYSFDLIVDPIAI